MDAWQNIAAIATVSASGCYLIFRIWTFVTKRRAAGCGSGCSDCPATDAARRSESFVPIDQLQAKRPQL